MGLIEALGHSFSVWRRRAEAIAAELPPAISVDGRGTREKVIWVATISPIVERSGAETETLNSPERPLGFDVVYFNNPFGSAENY